jgi:tellurite resistance protein TehA-like permease
MKKAIDYIKDKILPMIEYLWVTTLLYAFAIVSVYLFMEIMKFSRENFVSEWVIQITGIILAIATIGMVIKIAIWKSRLLKRCIGKKK